MVTQYDLYDKIKGKSWMSSKEVAKLVYGEASKINNEKAAKRLRQLMKYGLVEKRKLTTDWEKNIYGNTYIYRVNPNAKFEE